MFDMNAKSAGYELSWFVKRYNALLVDFPGEIFRDVLMRDSLCSEYDSTEVYEALKSAHNFLTSLTSEMLSLPEQNEGKMKHIEKVFTKIDLLWSINCCGELIEENNEYCIKFNKSALKTNIDTVPSNYSISFDNIRENGCYTEYFKKNESVIGYKSCDKGVLHFDDRIIALGLNIFVKKVLQKRWYWDLDLSGGYSKKLAFNPVRHCIEPYYRADMRVFICGEGLKYDCFEHLAGYNDEMVGYFKRIYEFVEENYPQCLPGQGFFKYINCAMTFSFSAKHRMLGQIGVGGDEHSFGFYTGLAGKEMAEFMSRIDEFEFEILGDSIVEPDKNILDKPQVNEITYRGQRYIFKNSKTKEFRFPITGQSDVEQIIKLMDIKARHKQKTIK